MSDEIAVSVCYLWADRRPNFFQMEFNLYQQSAKKKTKPLPKKKKNNLLLNNQSAEEEKIRC